MANWMTGSIKLRGNSNDILKFFNEGLKKKPVVVEETGNQYEIYLDHSDDSYEIDILDTDRASIIPFYVSSVTLDKGENAIAYLEIQQAWDFRVEDWTKIAKKYNLDIRLYGIDGLGGFMHQIDILNGEVALDECNNFGSYDNFVWNCPFPWMGG